MPKAFCRCRRAAGFQTRGTKPKQKELNECLSCLDFRSKFLKGDDIEAGETVTIKDVRDELVGKDRKLKPVLYMEEYDRGIILNKTNARALVKDPWR